MRLADLQPGAEVKVDIRGRTFNALVTGKPAGGRIPINPLMAGCGYLSATPHQVKELVGRPGDQLPLEAS